MPMAATFQEESMRSLAFVIAMVVVPNAFAAEILNPVDVVIGGAERWHCIQRWLRRFYSRRQ